MLLRHPSELGRASRKGANPKKNPKAKRKLQSAPQEAAPNANTWVGCMGRCEPLHLAPAWAAAKSCMSLPGHAHSCNHHDMGQAATATPLALDTG